MPTPLHTAWSKQDGQKNIHARHRHLRWSPGAHMRMLTTSYIGCSRKKDISSDKNLRYCLLRTNFRNVRIRGDATLIVLIARHHDVAFQAPAGTPRIAHDPVFACIRTRCGQLTIKAWSVRAPAANTSAPMASIFCGAGRLVFVIDAVKWTRRRAWTWSRGRRGRWCRRWCGPWPWGWSW